MLGRVWRQVCAMQAAGHMQQALRLQEPSQVPAANVLILGAWAARPHHGTGCWPDVRRQARRRRWCRLHQHTQQLRPA